MVRVLLSLIWAALLFGCGKSSVPLPDDAHPALWEIRTDNGKPVGWLFGTVHALPDGLEWRFPALEKVIEQADTLVVEVSTLEDGASISAQFAKMGGDEPPSLSAIQRIEPALRAEFQKVLNESSLDQSDLDSMESWAAALTLAAVSQTGDTDNGVDRALLRRFDGRPIIELEGAAAQLQIFDSLPESEQIDLLNAVLKEAKHATTTTERMTEAWRLGDLETLEQITARGMLADPELRKALLTNRNRLWAAVVGDAIGSGDRPLVAVGAGHMLGPEGLPVLLAEAGYTVVRVP
ncbi:TraB/GumN family protein [Erythrobacter litoralis]|uniref:TraB/GumN family protein n=1 Tax=Erythrobacter litoralis TaxID=39960 RepID=UPI0024356D2A|nr:TraB/GumN family protein [Erythrobacter litoralis]MDG6079555.1 TraB/GumN family protein [Erythrobacter litoralis]